MPNIAIITAAGKGVRMKEKVNKILLTLVGKTIIEETIEVFENCDAIDSIILVGNSDDIDQLKKIIEKNQYKKIKKIVEGGAKRQDSVYNGIKSLESPNDEDILLIHNGANPLVDEATILECINQAKEHGAAVAAMHATDTIKEAEDGFVVKSLEREKLWHMQTPQAIQYKTAKEAFEKAYKDNFCGSDDDVLVERLGKKVRIVDSTYDKKKITTKKDLERARLMKTCSVIGIGQDSHEFTDKEKPLVLGGITIPNENGLDANSDGDVILHALFNALSQAVGGRSLGCYADPMCKKGVTDSREYLKVVLDMVNKKDYRINNVGFMMEAKKPRLDDYEEKIKESIANLLGIGKGQVGITVTSGEELTPFGQGKAIQVFSVASLSRK
ncbi:MAG: 2-C-methyl-D-erythritol 4-phosphate cytidylyltransferase [Candidatus Omnitrophota bacterium]|nr:MAG: 2-C-methyl-D-erythritol 4-phosphate cytidylyltransferase [Candidatus Omnitrophota bacterium]